jgi:hypothetical protein
LVNYHKLAIFWNVRTCWYYRNSATIAYVKTQQALNRFADMIGQRVAPGRFSVGQGPLGATATVHGVPFALEFAARGSTDQILSALRRLQACGAVRGLVVVPKMGETGARLCEEAGVSWMDWAGNAQIEAPGVLVSIRGRVAHGPRGRPPSLFAPRASRLAHALLLDPTRTPTQAELASETGLGVAVVASTMARYEEAGFAVHDGGRPRRYALIGPDQLLDAWREDYSFARHTTLAGHVAARSGRDLLERLSGALAAAIPYAVTALAGAWLMAPHADFRLVTTYVEGWPHPDVLESLGFREEPRGANLWLVVPRDSEPLERAQETRGIRHVSPVWAYLDLKGHPERSEEAAEELRRQRLRWGRIG